MKTLARFLFVALTVAATFGTASAITDGEMNKAKAIAAKYYVRYSNNASGYLNDVEPESMSDLEGALKNDKDKQSLKEFQKANVAKDYAGWNRDQLVAYWTGEFFKANQGVLTTEAAVNQECRRKIREAIQSLKVSNPSPVEETVETTVEETVSEPVEEQLAQVLDGMQQQEMTDEEQIASDDSVLAEIPKQEASSGSWVYIMVLCILVVVVVILVVYASKTMKSKPREERAAERERETRETRREEREVRQKRLESRREPAPLPVVDKEEDTVPLRPLPAADASLREKYAETLAEKNEEIRGLSRRIGELNATIVSLRAENEALKARIAEAENAEPLIADVYHAPRPGRPQTDIADTRVVREETVRRNQGRNLPIDEEPAERGGDTKKIYLGRVNANGVFVRADRNIKPGLTMYELITNNGLSGTYSVVKNPDSVGVAMEDPGRWLAGGCVAKDIFDTDSRDSIITETPGTAIFEEGAWRVLRKARIRYNG